MPDIDDAVATPLIAKDGTAGEVFAAMSVQMFPPLTLARWILKAMADEWGFQPVTGSLAAWRPRSPAPVAAVMVARDGRTIITAGSEVMFDASVDVPAAVASDDVDLAWADIARRSGRVVVLIGGPTPLRTQHECEAAVQDRNLFGGWATFSAA